MFNVRVEDVCLVSLDGGIAETVGVGLQCALRGDSTEVNLGPTLQYTT